MLVKTLIEKLEKYDPNMEVQVLLHDESWDYSPVVNVDTDTVNYKEDPDGETLSTSECVIISYSE